MKKKKLTNLEFKKIFDRVAHNYDQISNSHAVSKRKDFFVKQARGRCLEVGAGTGVISLALKQKGLRVVATDISSKMVSQIKKKGIEAVVCDAEDLPFKEKSFDTVIAAEMLYYLDHPEKFIKEASRVLRPGGILLISSANEKMKILDQTRTWLRKLGMSKTYFDDPIDKFITTQQLTKLLIRRDFKNIITDKIVFGMFIIASARK